MKIGITCYPTFGGSGVLATELGKALAIRGHEIHFIAYALPQRLAHIEENLFFHEVHVNTYPLFEFPPYSLALTSKMVDVVRHAGLDLLHVHYAIPHATSAVQARDILSASGIRIPVVTTLHGTDITLVGQDPSYAPVVTHSINQSDGVTAVSEYLRKETFEQFQITKDIHVIPNFVDTSRFRRQHKQHFKRVLCPDGEKVVVHVSNFRKVKRAREVVKIFARLLDRGLQLKLILVGDGPERIPTEELARKLGVYQHCRFLGKQGPVEEILSIGDLFLMPSGSESFGLAALEAMSCSVPALTSSIGGLPELNIDGETGFLCDLDDTECFVDHAAAILSDDDLQKRMAAAARARAVDKFDITKIVPQYESYYKEVVGSRELLPSET
ncbi:MAG: N-acetyl-alpha-D-glucosaminyl L-malate synthase BshA [Rhodothermia bacterium]